MGPLLSIVIISYNHQQYIQQCIDSILMQTISFQMEIIIADDCSSDETEMICKEYESQHQGLIKFIPSEHNLGAVENEQRAFLAAKGKYIATCEGDDYWTDPMKLQKQVDFMESHTDYSVCFHRFKKLHTEDGREESDGCDNLFANTNESSIDISMHQFMHQWCTQYLSMVFRKDCYDFNAYKRYKYYRDTHQVYHLMENGKCRLFSFTGGIYRMTGRGSYTTMDSFHRSQMTLAVDKELWKINGDKRWKEMCAVVMQNIIDNFATLKEYQTVLLKYAFIIFLQRREWKKYIKNLFAIIR